MPLLMDVHNKVEGLTAEALVARAYSEPGTDPRPGAGSASLAARDHGAMEEDMTRTRDTADDAAIREPDGMIRRALLGAAGGALAVAASGLVVPEWLVETEAREGALGGAMGGRRGNDHKGRHKPRTHGDKKDDKKDDRNNGQDRPRGKALFRDTALTVDSLLPVHATLECSFFFRRKTGLDDYDGPWQFVRFERIEPGGAAIRFAPNRFRVGVLLQVPNTTGNVGLFVDVRNRSFGFPAGSLRGGFDLDPASGKLGTTIFDVNNYFVHEYNEGSFEFSRHSKLAAGLQRQDDSDDFIEFTVAVMLIG